MTMSFLSVDPSGQVTSCANRGKTSRVRMKSRNKMNLEAIEVKVIVGISSR